MTTVDMHRRLERMPNIRQREHRRPERMPNIRQREQRRPERMSNIRQREHWRLERMLNIWQREHRRLELRCLYHHRGMYHGRQEHQRLAWNSIGLSSISVDPSCSKFGDDVF
jgi:hypothetical protein